MDWFVSPYLLVAFIAYALIMLSLLALYFRGAGVAESPTGRSGSADAPGRAAASAPAGAVDVVEVGEGFSQASPDRASERTREFTAEAERLFSSEKDPVFVASEGLNVFYRNRAAAKVFGETLETGELPFHTIIGAEEKGVRKQLLGKEPPVSASIACLLPNGKNGTASVRLAVLNRMPRILALRVTGLEEEKPSWLSRPGKGSESTSLTRGGHLDFREVDPASVELSADQMLGPLREMDESLAKVAGALQKEDVEASRQSLQPARNRLRRLIRHIEEIDWMLQVTDGHLHLRPETFQAYEVLEAMAEAANRVSTSESTRLKLDPQETPPMDPLLSGDRRIFEKVLTQLLTSAFRAAGSDAIRATYRTEPLENPSHSDDWYLFAGESEVRSESTLLTIHIEFDREEETRVNSDLPAVVETLGSQIMDPRTTRRLEFVKKGRDSDLFGLTLARELVGKLDGDLVFQSDASGRSEFVLRLTFENAS